MYCRLFLKRLHDRTWPPKNQLVRGRDISKKEGYVAGGNHFFICTLCSKTTLRLETFKNGGILQLAAMFCQGVLFTLVKKASSRNVFNNHNEDIKNVMPIPIH